MTNIRYANTCNNFVKSMLQLWDNFDLVCKTLVTKCVCDKARQWSDMDTIKKKVLKKCHFLSSFFWWCFKDKFEEKNLYTHICWKRYSTYGRYDMTLKKVYLQSTICFKRVMLHWSKGFFHKYQIDFSKRSSYTCQIKSCHFFTLLPSDSVVEKVVLHFRLSPLLVLWSQSEEITQAVLSLHNVEVISISLG